MAGADPIVEELRVRYGRPPLRGPRMPGLDLRGRQSDELIDVSNAWIAGPTDLSNARLRGGLRAMNTILDGPVRIQGTEFGGDVGFGGATFRGPVEVSWTRVLGRFDAWRARFLEDAEFFQWTCDPGSAPAPGFMHPGECNFSWAWFLGRAVFDRCHFEGPVYFWRTRFLGDCRFDGSSFARDATFMGCPSEVCLSREELGDGLFTRLEDLGLIQPDRQVVALRPDRTVHFYGQLVDVRSGQELDNRMTALGLSDAEQALVRHEYRRHQGPMFARTASLRRLRIGRPREVKFMALNAEESFLEGTPVEAIAFFNAAQEPVPSSVGLGGAYDRVFISYGGPDVEFAGRLNRSLQHAGVETFFYPEHSIPGRTIDAEMRSGVAGFDRVLLVCSRTAPDRPGWRFELERAVERERSTGRCDVLLVAAVDDGLWVPWPAGIEPLRLQLLERTVADFRGVLEDATAYQGILARLLAGLRGRRSEV